MFIYVRRKPQFIFSSSLIFSSSEGKHFIDLLICFNHLRPKKLIRRVIGDVWFNDLQKSIRVVCVNVLVESKRQGALRKRFSFIFNLSRKLLCDIYLWSGLVISECWLSLCVKLRNGYFKVSSIVSNWVYYIFRVAWNHQTELKVERTTNHQSRTVFKLIHSLSSKNKDAKSHGNKATGQF